jgi:ABC-type multidrug transport system fused ATPase/permease subunit
MLDRFRLVFYFFGYLRPLRWLVVAAVVAVTVSALLRLPVTFLPKVLTENFESNRSYVYWYLLGVLGTFMLAWVLAVALSYWGGRLGATLVMSLRNHAFRRLEHLSMLAVFARGPGEFVQGLGRDVYLVRQVVDDTLLRSGPQVVQGAAVLVSMLLLDPLLTLSLAAVFAAMGLIVRGINRRVERYAHEGRDLEQSITGRLVENIGGFRDIVASGRFRDFAGQFQELLDQSAKVSVTAAVWGQTAGLVPWMVVSLATLGVYYFGLRGISDVSQVGEVITFAALLGQLFPAIMAATQWTSNLAIAMPSLRALHSILEHPELARTGESEEIALPVRSIVFDHVTLEVEGRRIIDDMSLVIPGNKFTAIVGQSGAGKTTVFNLLLRLLEPTSGVVLLNDMPLSGYTLDSLRTHIGFIPQRPFIFNQSLRDNLLMAAPQEPAPEKLQGALELAQLDEVVERRRDQGGIDAVAGYLGNRLSGGEQQRIALGRLALQDPAVIICDEYTANIDVQTARVINEAMRLRFRDRTRVVITHQLYSIKGADHIIVLDRGRAIDSGTHEELIARPGLYQDLWQVQALE